MNNDVLIEKRHLCILFFITCFFNSYEIKKMLNATFFQEILQIIIRYTRLLFIIAARLMIWHLWFGIVKQKILLPQN